MPPGNSASIFFGYLVGFTGGYDRLLPLLAAVLAAGAIPWLHIGPDQVLIPSRTPSGA